jgi:hypothetical protein
MDWTALWGALLAADIVTPTAVWTRPCLLALRDALWAEEAALARRRRAAVLRRAWAPAGSRALPPGVTTTATSTAAGVGQPPPPPPAAADAAASAAAAAAAAVASLSIGDADAPPPSVLAAAEEARSALGGIGAGGDAPDAPLRIFSGAGEGEDEDEEGSGPGAASGAAGAGAPSPWLSTAALPRDPLARSPLLPDAAALVDAAPPAPQPASSGVGAGRGPAASAPPPAFPRPVVSWTADGFEVSYAPLAALSTIDGYFLPPLLAALGEIAGGGAPSASLGLLRPSLPAALAAAAAAAAAADDSSRWRRFATLQALRLLAQLALPDVADAAVAADPLALAFISRNGATVALPPAGSLGLSAACFEDSAILAALVSVIRGANADMGDALSARSGAAAAAGAAAPGAPAAPPASPAWAALARQEALLALRLLLGVPALARAAAGAPVDEVLAALLPLLLVPVSEAASAEPPLRPHLPRCGVPGDASIPALPLPRAVRIGGGAETKAMVAPFAPPGGGVTAAQVRTPLDLAALRAITAPPLAAAATASNAKGGAAAGVAGGEPGVELSATVLPRAVAARAAAEALVAALRAWPALGRAFARSDCILALVAALLQAPSHPRVVALVLHALRLASDSLTLFAPALVRHSFFQAVLLTAAPLPRASAADATEASEDGEAELVSRAPPPLPSPSAPFEMIGGDGISEDAAALLDAMHLAA